MSVAEKLNSSPMYLICGGIIAFVAVVCVIFMVRAYRQGKALGMDTVKMKRVIVSSATFSVLPSVGILLGVIALSGSLGIPWPWLRLSVIGALHYETQVAQGAAEQVGMKELSSSEMTASGFATIALLMSICIIWGMVLSVLFNKKYTKKLVSNNKKNVGAGFGDTAMTAMFIGLVSAYIGSYIGAFASSEGLFTFKGDWTPLLVVAVSAAVMALFVYLSSKKKFAWVDSFSIAVSMLVGMAAAVVVKLIYRRNGKMDENKDLNWEKYSKKTHVIGRTVSIIALVMLVGAPFLIGTYLGAMPDLAATAKGFVAVGLVWLVSSIAEFLIYTPMLGSGGGYLAFITGNLINMKIPCAVNARDMVGAKTGTRENEIISTLSIATSSLVTIVVLAVGVAILTPLRPVLESPTLQPAFANVVPALFGAMAYKYYRKNIKVAIAPLVLMSVLFILVPSLVSSTSFMIIPSGAIAIGIAFFFYKKGKRANK